MGFYGEQIVPRITDRACGTKEHTRLRRRVCEGLDGTVMEIGFGSGLNLPHYPTGIRTLYAVDPAVVGRKLAAQRLEASPLQVEFVGLDGEELPLDDESVDHVVSTWTLCTIPGVEQALREARRVLRPGGTFRFLEHGLAPDAKVARWQHRLDSLQQKVAGGCHLNRSISELVEGSGLTVGTVDNFYMAGPKPFVYQYEGTAKKT